MTARVQPNRLSAFFRLFDRVADAYLIVDVDDRLLHANRRARALLDNERCRVDENVFSLFTEPEALKPSFAMARGTGEPLPIAASAHSSDGEEPVLLLLEGSAFPLSGRSVLLLRIRLESEANAGFDTLNQHIALNSEIARHRMAREALEDAYESLERFASVAAHDLKSPARHLCNLSDMLLDCLGSSLKEEEATLLTMIGNSAQRLSRLVDDIYTYANSPKSNAVFSAICLQQVVSCVLEDLSETVKENHAVVEVGNLPTVEGGESHLRQLFQNLIQNAIKYRHPERTPEVKVEAAILDDGGCKISVLDNGAGFDPLHAEKIFEPFERVVDPDGPEGTGLGLASCRNVATLHGWAISASSEPGNGSVFDIHLPSTALAAA